MQVVLQPSALSVDTEGQAAAVTAGGGNRAKLKNGVGAFKDVRLSADTGGTYALRIASGSRKVWLQSS